MKKKGFARFARAFLFWTFGRRSSSFHDEKRSVLHLYARRLIIHKVNYKPLLTMFNKCNFTARLFLPFMRTVQFDVDNTFVHKIEFWLILKTT